MKLARRPIISALGAAALAAFLAAPLPALAQDGVHIDDAWARFVPGARSGVVYMRIENRATVAETLLSVSSDVSAMASLHQSAKDAAGMMTMEPLPDGLPIAPGASAELKSGGTHIMLMDLTRQPKVGEAITLTLTFAHAGKVTVEVPVKNRN